ncbi:MAG: hypothetical protein ABW252_20220 [Polyangiales bacterium]
MNRPIQPGFAVLFLAIVLTACSSSSSTPTGDGSTPTDEDGGPGPGGDGGRDRDGAMSDPTDGAVADGGGDAGDGGNQDPNSLCNTTGSCAADDCGEVPRCGTDQFLSCADCAPGYVCGQYALNKCGLPPPDECTPKTAAEVCPGKCGAVSDECSGVVVCTATSGGLSCDANQRCENATCVATGATCTAKTCTELGHQCGLHGDGCGGVLNCGGCDSDERCDYTASPIACIALPPTTPTCTPLTRAAACAGNCGVVGNGCGGMIDCEADASTRCPTGQTCGGGGQTGICGSGMTACIPTASECAGKCGSQSNGCGGLVACTNSNGGVECNTAQSETCGGGGTPNACGKVPCTPRTTLQACPFASGETKSCGQQPDGCGGLIDCGGCAGNQVCGLDEASRCGTIPSCMPTPVATACAGKCGTVPDGCGGSYACSGSNGGVSCTGTEYCGATRANECGSPVVTCQPRTCAQLGHSCGLASDGCGRVLNCWPTCATNDANCTGTCPAASSCLSNQTGAQSCVMGGPTCSGALCNTVPTSCASNAPTRLTGTVRTPGRLESGSFVNQLPVPNAIVYIPADPATSLPTVFEGVTAMDSRSCGRCADEKLVADGQSVLAAAVTDYKGEFTLEGRIPVGTKFNLVVKVGKWRRVVEVPAGTSAACASRALTLEYTRLAASPADGLNGTWLPKIAVSTGDVDAMECVLLGMGIAQSQFTLPSGSGRVHMYRANGARMRTCNGNYTSAGVTTACSASDNAGCVNSRSGCSWSNTTLSAYEDKLLYAAQNNFNLYDLVVFDCEGNGHYRRSEASRNVPDAMPRLLAYVNAGGRAFASHWSYEWLDNNPSSGAGLDLAAAWTSDGDGTTATGLVSLPTGATARTQANPVKSLLYRDWLRWQGALSGTTAGQTTNPATPQIAITDPRDVAGQTVGSSTDEWMYRTRSGARVQQLSFNTPYAASEANICGRVAFSGFHVASSSGGTTLSTNNVYFPGECRSGALTAQEKTLAFMLFDLATCVSAGDPPSAPSCTPKTIANTCPGANDACGYVSDGCGGVVDCAGCAAGYYCDGNTCRPQECTPSTCASLGYNCGNHADGCGGIARNAQGQEGCGTCTNGQTCGLTQAGLCGGCSKIPYATACPTNSCGQVSDGCGGTHDCGSCPSGVCGGGGANRCGSGSCTPIPKPTACLNKNCGVVADGCGGTYNCGDPCAMGTCGGGGQANVCGTPTCTKKTAQQACAALGYNCGYVSDGCGGTIKCGDCPNNGVCGGAGTNKCGNDCMPTTCGAQGANCGAISDRCGALLSCGTCPTGQTCGAQTANQCGTGTTCTKRTCQQAGAQCGLVGDGCGGVLDCGTCTAPQTCGGASVPNQCGVGQGGCNKLTCATSTPAIECGPTTDGCGGILDCGACPSGESCAPNGQCEPIVI